MIKYLKAKNVGLFLLLFLVITGVFICFNFKEKEILKSSVAEDYSFLKDGDVIFQISQSGQGKAIQLATHSKYTHCGIVFKENNKYVVYEAVQPVKKTPLKEWISYGENKSYAVKRLKTASADLTPEVLTKMKVKYNSYAGKNYDWYFGWTDEKIYCSELVWKMYKSALDIELGKPQKLKDFDLTNPIVIAKLDERYGKKIPYEEIVISPAAVFDSELLESVEVK